MIERSRIESFVVKKTNYYVDRLGSIEHGNGLWLNFNWAAFFVSGFWMIYRKLYLQVGILILVLITIELSGLGALLDWVSPILIGSVIGFYGNYWYLQRFNRFDEMARDQSSDPSTQERYLHSKGGTNAVGVWIGILLIVASFGAGLN